MANLLTGSMFIRQPPWFRDFDTAAVWAQALTYSNATRPSVSSRMSLELVNTSLRFLFRLDFVFQVFQIEPKNNVINSEHDQEESYNP
jgi:hypothetical protein